MVAIYICKLDKSLYGRISDELDSDEVVITEERIRHIRANHPEDYDRFISYIPRVISDPDYIIEANKAHTVVILKEIVDNGERLKLVLRLRISTDPADYKNSVISFWRIGKSTWDKTLRNKVILYKSSPK